MHRELRIRSSSTRDRHFPANRRSIRPRGHWIASLLGLLLLAAPTTADAQVTTLSLPDLNGLGGDTLSGSVLLDSVFQVQGTSIAICHDPSVVSTATMTLGNDLAIANNGSAPDFLQLDSFPNGFAAGAIISLVGTVTLAPGSDLEIFDLEYTTFATANGSSAIDFCLIGNPPVTTTVIVNGSPVALVTLAGSINLGPPPNNFERGDCNDDGTRNIADAIALLSNLFPGASAFNPPCFDACEVNDDGALNIADAVFLLSVLFGSGILPEPVNCGEDPTPADAFDCVSSGSC